VMRFIELICHKDGMNIGSRRLTLSTCGIIENIDRLAEYDVQLTLAVSLHAPDDETRSKLMPVNRNNSINDLFRACERYYNNTGRRVTYEYALIDEVNDSPEQASMLSDFLHDSKSHLNLILLSGINECKLKPSNKKNVEIFTDILKNKDVNYTIRRSLGSDIDAACGQLRRRNMETCSHGTMGNN